MNTATIDESTDQDDITEHLDAIGIEYSLDTEAEGIRIDSGPHGAGLLIYRHGPHEGDGVANLWAWGLRDDVGDVESDGLDRFDELPELVIRAWAEECSNLDVGDCEQEHVEDGTTDSGGGWDVFIAEGPGGLWAAVIDETGADDPRHKHSEITVTWCYGRDAAAALAADIVGNMKS